MALTKKGVCNHCGDCCKGDPRGLAKHILPADEYAKYEQSGKNDGYCYFYDTTAERCRIYSVRPWFCRDWPSTPEELRSVQNCSLTLIEYVPMAEPAPVSAPTAPPTHIVLPLNVRDAMIKQLGPLPLNQVEGIANALRKAPTVSVTEPPAPDSPAQEANPNGR